MSEKYHNNPMTKYADLKIGPNSRFEYHLTTFFYSIAKMYSYESALVLLLIVFLIYHDNIYRKLGIISKEKAHEK